MTDAYSGLESAWPVPPKDFSPRDSCGVFKHSRQPGLALAPCSSTQIGYICEIRGKFLLFLIIVVSHLLSISIDSSCMSFASVKIENIELLR